MTYDPTSPGKEEELDFLLSIAAKILVRSSDPKAFFDWIADAGPKLLTGLVPQEAARTGAAGDVFRVLGREIYNATPLPELGFRPNVLPKPGRNDPCSCGSGRKYKHCCLALEGMAPPLRDYNFLRHVLDWLPLKRFAEIPSSHADRDAVWDAARQWKEEGDAKRAVALLEPWFAEGRTLAGRLEPIFDLLMDCYLALGNERKRARLVQCALDRGDRALRAAALQRRTTMLADQGKAEQAWETFREAQREDPSNPGHAHLEVILLASQGAYERAGERARFWIASLERRRDPLLADLIGLLREVAADPKAGIASMGRMMRPDVGRLKGLFDGAPAPVARHVFNHPDEHSAGPLAADAALARAESRWRKAFPRAKPALAATQHGDQSVWDSAQAWLGLLESTPDLWQSFDVLDDLAMALDALPTLGTGEDLLEPILERAVRLLRLNLETKSASGLHFEWGWMENRPALRLAAHLAFRQLERADWPSFVLLAEWMLSLNPNDNHGLREPLSRAYLEIGAPEQTVNLTDKYPDDGMTGTTLNRILANWRCGRTNEALTELANAARHCEVAIRMLIAQSPRQPTMSAYGITVGGKDEAWLYREEHLHLWARDGALDWLRKAWRAAPHARIR